MDYNMPDITEEQKRQQEEMKRNNRMYNSTDMHIRPMQSMRNGGIDRRESYQKEIEEIYCALDERMCEALCFHEQLADYFCFLGLQGFKRMLEYQYLDECKEKRKLHHHYIDQHHRIIPVKEKQNVPMMIPKEWSRYTTKDIDDSVIPKFVRIGLKRYEDWERETRDIFEEQCQLAQQLGLYTDYEYIKQMLMDVEKELKKVKRTAESLNGTGYDVTAIHNMQDKYHEKYKEKYRERFTNRYTMPDGERRNEAKQTRKKR